MKDFDAPRIRSYNRRAWDGEVARGNPWTVPVDASTVAAARRGEWSVVLTPQRAVPREWFGSLTQANVLCLASGGGQQAPVLAAAGARVTVVDNSPKQLEQDRRVAARDGLEIETVEADMADLSRFADASFDLVFHPVANCFVPDVRPVWREAYRVLRAGGVLLAGFIQPVYFAFDEREASEGPLLVRHEIPYSDVGSLEGERLRELLDRGEPLLFGHTLEDQIAGQLEAGFLIAGFYEDRDAEGELSRHLPTFVATRALKPRRERR